MSALFVAAWVGLAIAAYWTPKPGKAPASAAAPVRGTPLTAPRVSGDAAAATPAAAAPVVGADGTTAVAFEVLAAFAYDPPTLEYDDQGNAKPLKPELDPVPKRIRDLSGRRVSVRGYMIPYNYVDGTCSKFALSEFPPTCCFGCNALPNNWIEVTMPEGKNAKCSTDGTVRVEGVLEVHGLLDELATLYTMQGEAVSADGPR